MKRNQRLKEIALSGLFDNNPVFKLVLGMCPTLAVTTSVMNGIGMGLSTTFVLLCANILISLLRDAIPDKVRMPAYILIIATFVTLVEMIMKKYTPDLYDSLGLYIPLIVVNCIIMGRAEAFASQNPVLDSMVDGFSMGLGFTGSLILLSAVRELFGAGELFGFTVLGSWFPVISILVRPAGGFLVLGLLMAAINQIEKNKKKRRNMKITKAKNEEVNV